MILRKAFISTWSASRFTFLGAFIHGMIQYFLDKYLNFGPGPEAKLGD